VIQIAVIGGGVIGCAVARELSKRHRGIFVFEKNPGIAKGENQSTRNSGVIHSGIYYDRTTRPLKAALCVKGNQILYNFCERHRVPVLRTGKLIVAAMEEEEKVLDLYLHRAGENGVPGVRKISGEAVRAMEPNVTARAALWVPSAGIVDPAALVYRLHTHAREAGVEFMAGTRVTGIRGGSDSLLLTLRYRDGLEERVRARVLVNAAGVDADLLARQLNPRSPYVLDPVKGESYKFYGNRRFELRVAGRNIYPTPRIVHTPHGAHFTVGVHLTPTFKDFSWPPALGSTVTVGPRLAAVGDREKWMEVRTGPDEFVELVKPFFPGLRKDDLIWHQAGLQARLRGFPDFVIEPDPRFPRCIHLLGIDSPGLTASMAIARQVAGMITGLLS